MLSYRARIGATTMVLAGIGLLAAGCGGSSGSSGTPAAPATTAGGGFAAYTDCLAHNGVTLPARSPGARPSGQPGGGGGGGGGGGFGNQKPAGVDQATWDKAQQACASTRPTGGPGGGGAGGNSAMVAYRNCLSDHGVTMTGGPGQLNTADPATAAAVTACAALRPTGGPSPAN